MSNHFQINSFVFAPPVLLKRPNSGQRWELAQNWDVSWKDFSGTRALTIPAGFKTDLMTSPLKPAGNETIPSILHDGLYVLQPEWCTRGYADEAFLALLTTCGVAHATSLQYFSAVQTFGFLWWNRHKSVGSAIPENGENASGEEA